MVSLLSLWRAAAAAAARQEGAVHSGIPLYWTGSDVTGPRPAREPSGPGCACIDLPYAIKNLMNVGMEGAGVAMDGERARRAAYAGACVCVRVPLHSLRLRGVGLCYENERKENGSVGLSSRRYRPRCVCPGLLLLLLWRASGGAVEAGPDPPRAPARSGAPRRRRLLHRRVPLHRTWSSWIMRWWGTVVSLPS